MKATRELHDLAQLGTKGSAVVLASTSEAAGLVARPPAEEIANEHC